MLGFCPFATAPFSATGSGAPVMLKADFIGEAMVTANAIAVWVTGGNIVGEAMLKADSTIAGSGWVRQNPDSGEWDYKQSSDWNTIK
jgi:hypothetical protein|tara:strand:+ start:492 stop:752 length:261 start_codon:yes stop_codon:yes gene_type:complete